jgi:soluble lytic murein transglycosylase-like protein
LDGEDMNIVEQAWANKWNQVFGMYQSKLDALHGYGRTGFAEALSFAQAAATHTGLQVNATGAAGARAGSVSPPTAYDSLIKEASTKYSVPESLIKGVIKAESGFNPGAVSCCGAMGLMQLMPGTASGLKVTDAFDPAQNIDGGTRYLAGLIKRYGGDVGLALTAYNRGPGKVGSLSDTKTARDLWNGLSAGARTYAETVLGYARDYGYTAGY